MKYRVRNHGSIISIHPGKHVRQWIRENCATEGWQWMGGALHIDARYASNIIDGLIDAGFVAS